MAEAMGYHVSAAPGRKPQPNSLVDIEKCSAGPGAHGPNEYMVIEPAEGSGITGLAEIEKGYVDLLYAFAGGWQCLSVTR